MTTRTQAIQAGRIAAKLKNEGKQWTTVCTVGFNGGVNPYDEDRRAHGGVIHYQIIGDGKIGRKVASNGRFQEISEAFFITLDQKRHWEALAARER